MTYQRSLTIAAAFLVTVILGSVAQRATPPGRTTPLAYVAVAANNHVLVVDLASGRSLRKIYSGATPWRLVPSSDRRQLWIQHWYAGNTAVVDLEDHEIVGILPSSRGPGTFTADGERFLSFDWPSSSLRSYDPQSFELAQEQVTEVGEVYDVVADPGGSRLYLAQHDPMAQGPRERYGYVLVYPYREKDPARATPVSYRTGRSPARMRTAAQGAFLLTADRDTNGLSLINRLGDGRSVPACPAPQEILLAPDEGRMVVTCWRGSGSAKSQVVSYRTDFAARPWPVVTQEASVEVAGGLVAGAFTPSGHRVYLVDRTGGRLLECDPVTLRTLRELHVGDEPVDVAILDRPVRVRDRLAAGESQSRKRLKAALPAPVAASRPGDVLTWVETARWTSPPPVEGAAPGEAVLEGSARRSYLLAPDSWRVESDEGAVRLSAAGHTVSIDASGRYWVTPRQHLIAAALLLPLLAPDEAVRQLAGDVPGSPFLRSGLAVDLVREVQEGGARALLVGASTPDDRVSQLRIVSASGQVSSLVEQFPVFESRGHASPGFGGLVRTTLHDFQEVAGRRFPTRLERVIDGRWRQEVRIEGLEARSNLPPGRFDLARLGNLPIPSSLAAASRSGRTDDSPGRAVPILTSGYISRPGEPRAPYNSNPPTSGPRLRSIADWGATRIPIPLELQVHNLEHGGVAIQYNCPDGCHAWVERLEELVRGREFILLAPYPWMEARIALTAWGWIETMDDLDLERVRRFVETHAGKDHHSGSAVSRRAP